jgi:hypothetical protein
VASDNLGPYRSRWTPLRLAALSAAAISVSVLTAGTASAYCRTTTCDSKFEDCKINASTGCPASGVPLYWPDTCVTFGVQRDGSPKRGITFVEAQEAAEMGFRSWISAKCDSLGQHPSIGVVSVGQIACDKVQYNYPPPGQDFPPGPNANVIIFRDDAWPYFEDPTNERTTLALTTITYLKDTGEIVDADIEVNSASVPLSTTDTNITNDLQAILAHEAGHFFGLAHSTVSDATMNKLYNVNVGDATFRTLADDDRRGICDLYPPGAVEVGSCRGEGPRFGFSRFCHTPVQASAGLLCSATPGAVANSSSNWLGAALLVGGVGLLRARRRA